MTGRTLLRLTPVALFIAIVFLLPFLWWPPIRSDMARVIYFPFVIVSICAVYFITPRGNEAASFRAFIFAACSVRGLSTIRHFVSNHVFVTNKSNQALERTAAQRTFAFWMIKTVSIAAVLALGGGRLSLSR